VEPRIREQFPLPRDKTLEVAMQLGERHPYYPGTHVPAVMTVDFMVTKRINGTDVTEAFNVKPTVPDFTNCGRTPGVARGRSFKDGRTPYVIGDHDKTAFDAAIRKHYLKREYYKLTDSYQWMLERYYTFQDGNGSKFIE
jgi:hypothetical protein